MQQRQTGCLPAEQSKRFAAVFRLHATRASIYEHFGPSWVIITLWTDGKVLALSALPVGKAGVVEALDLPDAIQHHLMHMGFVPEARVVVVRRAPAGDPTVYAIDGFEIALRRETARSIVVRTTPEEPRAER